VVVVALVGTRVWSPTGEEVLCSFSYLIIEGVTDFDRCNVGEVVGWHDGIAVGINVGAYDDGAIVGTGDGCKVGAGVGALRV